MLKYNNFFLLPREIIVWLCINILSIITSVLLLSDSNFPIFYKYLSVLPISFGLINTICFTAYRGIFNKISYIVIILLYTIRNVITPLAMYLGNYEGGFKLLNLDNVNKALCIMIYESMIVFMFLCLLNRGISKIKVPRNYTKVLSRRKIKLFSIAVVGLVVICIAAYVKVPEIKLNYTSFFEGEKLVGAIGATELLPTGGINRILYTLFNFCFNIINIFISIWIIVNIKKWIGIDKISIVVALGIIFCQLFFMTSENAYTFIIMFVLLRIVYLLYPKQRKQLVFIIVAGVCIVGQIMYTLKLNAMAGNSSFEGSSTILQAYFPGICNMAGIFNVNNPNKLYTLFFDFYSMIPFRETLFGLSGERLVQVYASQNRAAGSILPCIAQAYHYLGFIFAPIVPCFFVYISVKYEQRLKDETNIFKQAAYTLLCLFAASTPIMYNMTIFGGRFLGTIFPIILLARYSRDKYKLIIE